MNVKGLLTVLAIGILSLSATLVRGTERIWLKDAKVDGKRVKLCFDTGSSVNVLCLQSVKRLGLKANTNPNNDPLTDNGTNGMEAYSLEINGTQLQMQFTPWDFPGYASPDVDGLIGWWALSGNVMRIDAASQKLTFLSKVPRGATKWTKFSVLTNFGPLQFEVPHDGRTNGIVSVDTGIDWGIALPAREWRRWAAGHPHTPITLRAFYTPTDGFVVSEEAWADRIAIGPLVLTDVPIIQESRAAEARWGDQNAGILGLAALNRLNVVIDGKNSAIYLQLKTTAPPAYTHNRLGAVFVPTPAHTNEAVALVIPGSPAYDAGIRNGDILVQVDGIHAISWSSDWLSKFELPAGTRLHCLLERNGTNFETVATLRQIIPPSTK